MQTIHWQRIQLQNGSEFLLCIAREKRRLTPSPSLTLTPLQRARGTLRARGVNSQITKLKLLKSWLLYNPRLRNIAKKKGHYYTPIEVKRMVDELGEPFDIE